MKRTLLLMIAIAFPWVILLMDDNPAGAFFAVILQCTVIGWIPASLWALRIVRTSPTFKQKKKKRKKKNETTTNTEINRQ